MSRILWITPKWPLPADDGAKVATRALLSNLPHRNMIDVLALAGNDESCDITQLKQRYGLNGDVTVIRRESVGSGLIRHLRNAKRMLLNPRTPATVSRYGTPAMQSEFQHLLNVGSYSHMVFDGLHVAALCSKSGIFAKPADIKVVYRAHNVEWDIWQKAVDKASPYLRPILNRQCKLMKRFELSVLEQVDLTAAVSSEDVAVFNTHQPAATIKHIPIGLDFSEKPAPMPPSPIQLGYIGRLDWPPNKDGLKWFLDTVWPKLADHDIHLTIAGSGDDSWLTALPHLGQNIRYIGRVDDVETFYKQCHAAIVPIFYGSGTRLKMIEPAAYGRPCVSTSAGAQGSSLTPSEYFAAESADEWVKVLTGLTPDTCVLTAKCARERLAPNFDQHRIADNFAGLLRSL